MTAKPNAIYLTAFGILLLCLATIIAQARTFPESPILLEPKNNSTYQFPGTETPILFSWEPVVDATAYEINVRVDNRPAAQTVTSSTGIYLNLHLDVRENRSAVFWSVRAKSGDTFGSISEIFTFIFGDTGTVFPTAVPLPTPTPTPTAVPLPPPRLLSPANGAAISAADALNLSFNWTIVPGAYQYLFIVYRNNEPIIERTIPYISRNERIADLFQFLYQWEVRSVNVQGMVGSAGERFSFTVGAGVYPTPTPMPHDPDLNLDGKVDSLDIYLLSALFLTNDPRVNFTFSGLVDPENLLRFLTLYRNKR